MTAATKEEEDGQSDDEGDGEEDEEVPISREEEIRVVTKETDDLEREMKEIEAAPLQEGMTRLPCCAHKVVQGFPLFRLYSMQCCFRCILWLDGRLPAVWPPLVPSSRRLGHSPPSTDKVRRLSPTSTTSTPAACQDSLISDGQYF